ncbi:MAG TPA: hypothetical protein VF807_11720 [Ktedonobacterales bacterium]
MHEQILDPSAAAHINQLIAEYGGFAGLALLALGLLCLAVGLLNVRHLRRVIGTLIFILLTTAICGLALYLSLGRVQASSRSLADYGFIAAHFIVIGLLTAVVAAPLISLGRVWRPDNGRSGVGWWLSRFAWGYFTVFVVAPFVGAAVEYLLALHPDMHFAPQGSGLFIIGEVFGALTGWFVIGPLMGLLNIVRVPMQRALDGLAGNRMAAAGTVFTVMGFFVLTVLAPFGQHLHPSLVLR